MMSGARVVRRGLVRAAAVYVALIGIAWCAVFPILWAVSGSLKKQAEVTEPRLLPSHPQWSNYGEVFTLMPFWRMLLNTVLYAACVTVGQ
ncbi:MAG: carbohydrate ABC transporter permease, partial [Mycobacteriaceae bacterium]|nr:carbohydrate ABC transporter permease [Mycobacteriaceae bacterium]